MSAVTTGVWEAERPGRYYGGRCETCGTEYESEWDPGVDEDGVPQRSFRTQECGCGRELCPECKAAGEAFVCEGCGKLFCAACMRRVEDVAACEDCLPVELEDAYDEARRKIARLEGRIKDMQAAFRRIAAIDPAATPAEMRAGGAGGWPYAFGAAKGIAEMGAIG